MFHKELMQPSSNSFSSPMLLVKKQDDTWKFCVDYMKVNAATKKHMFPIPKVDELGGSQYFSKLDIHAGYHQI